MGFLDDARSATHKRVFPNKIDEIKRALSDEEFAEFVAAMQDPTISQRAIVEALKKRGVHMGQGTLSYHRRFFLEKGDDK